MIPIIDNYPQFELNQVLTKDQLNNLFGYTDQQGRLTRSHLIGIGIVCGLDVQTAPAGNAITITRGCGVTSEGYLVIQETDVTHTFQRPYKVPKDPAYPPLDVNPAQYPIMELLPAAPVGDATVTALHNNNNYLLNKVVILFVELNKTANKNCLPNSCDDKGATISVTVRPLLIPKALADIIKLNIPSYTGKNALPDMRMPRFDVTATHLRTTDDVVNAYRNILTKAFIADTVAANLQSLVNTYSFLGLPQNDLNNAIQTLRNFTFAADNKLQLTRQYFYQYYYDFISDLIEAYNEIKDKAAPVLAACCPDTGWFRRHLFLREAFNAPATSQYRHYFIPSPAVAREGQRADEITEMFKRLYLMLASFPQIAAPSILTGNSVFNSFLRVTPSIAGCRLSAKSIPHYYSQEAQANGGRLFQHWNYQLTKAGRADQNLSYRAVEYPTSQDFVLTPLRYDLEPYNFFRIEGHVGKNYKSVLSYLNNLRKSNRLPFDVVAVKTGNKPDNPDLAEFSANFEDLENAYRLLRENIKCKGVNELDSIDVLSKLTPAIVTKLKSITPVKCEAEELEELFNAYKARVDALKNAFLLSNYAAKHPGLQHKGGVPAGGTFVMVYHGDMVAPPPVTGGASGILSVVTFDMAGAQMKRYAVDTQKAKRYNVDAKNLQTYTRLVEALDPNDPQTMKIAEDAFAAMIPQNKLVRNPGFSRTGFRAALPVEVTEGVVFADFFLPYTISNNGTQVQYIIQEKEQPLELIIDETHCVDGSNEVTFRISGGTPPYFLDNVEVKSKFTRSYGPNQGGTVTIRDSANAISAVEVAPKNCPPVCDLPCNGISYASRYPTWWPFPPKPVEKDALELQFAYLKIEDEQHAVIYDEDFSDELRNEIAQHGLDPATFDGMMESIVKRINENIQQQLPRYQGVVFDYVADPRAGEHLLRIRALQCHQFEFRVSYRLYNSFYDYRYTNSGTDVTVRWKDQLYQVRIPRFGAIKIDQCKDVSGKDCRFDFETERLDTNRLAIARKDNFKAAYWIVEGALPAAYSGWLIEIEPVNLPMTFRIVVLDNEGCWAYQELTLND